MTIWNRFRLVKSTRDNFVFSGQNWKMLNRDIIFCLSEFWFQTFITAVFYAISIYNTYIIIKYSLYIYVYMFVFVYTNVFRIKWVWLTLFYRCCHFCYSAINFKCRIIVFLIHVHFAYECALKRAKNKHMLECPFLLLNKH